MAFDGFPEQALVFYEGLRADNSKAYWSDHKAVYDAAVKAPMEALLAELEPEFGTAKFFRPYRDVRFSKDKTPYKDHAAAVAESGGALYLQLSADGLMLAGGYWHTETDQAVRLRAAIADELTGGQLAAVLAALTEPPGPPGQQGRGGPADQPADGAGTARARWEVGGDRLVRLPKPYEPDHPRADLLHLKSLTASVTHEPAEWLHEPECGVRVAQAWRALGPLNAWLTRHVGPSHRPARGR